MIDQLLGEDVFSAAADAEAARLAAVHEKHEAQRQQQKQRADEENERSRIARDKKAASAAKSKAARATDPANQYNVDVTWSYWGGTRSKPQKITDSASNVTIHTSGARAYIIFPDGDEIIVATKNLTIHNKEAAA